MTILADSSAWIEYFRRTDSKVCVAVREAIENEEVATTDPVVLEILAGTPRVHLQVVERLFRTIHYLAQEPLVDAESAVGIYRACRTRGDTPRSVNDCLIAAIAIRHQVRLLHRDRDFDAIARHCSLRTVDV